MTVEQRLHVQRYLQSKSNGRCRKPIDGEKIECESCNSTSKLEWHHIVPWSEGGDDEPENLQVLCESCHVFFHKEQNDFREAGRWGGLVSAYLREQRMGREEFCQYMRSLAMRHQAA